MQMVTADSLADYRDTNADGDLFLDSEEHGLTSFDATFADPDGSVDDPAGQLADLNSNTPEVAYREPNTPPVIDLNDGNTTADLDFAVEYTENDTPVSVADAAGSIIDPEDNISEITIVLAGAVDGDDERITIGGEVFLAGTDQTVEYVHHHQCVDDRDKNAQQRSKHVAGQHCVQPRFGQPNRR